MNNYELQLEQFSGPIEKLLALIEEKEMEITELSLAEITADFLQYLKNIEAVEPRLLADFVAIAAQLLLIKSRALLPDIKLTSEEEEKIKDLESRLLFYQKFKPAANYLKELSENKNISISRPLFFGRPPIFYPSENIKIENLRSAVGKIFESIQRLPEQQTVKNSLISLEQKIEEIIDRLNVKSKGAVDFGSLAKNKPRSEIIVLFLALLHLLSGQLVSVRQGEKFSDIMIEKK